MFPLSARDTSVHVMACANCVLIARQCFQQACARYGCAQHCLCHLYFHRVCVRYGGAQHGNPPWSTLFLSDSGSTEWLSCAQSCLIFKIQWISNTFDHDLTAWLSCAQSCLIYKFQWNSNTFDHDLTEWLSCAQSCLICKIQWISNTFNHDLTEWPA